MHVLLFVSGALGLVYEVLWMRRFGVLLGATPLAASATLAGFFLGHAAGSAVFGRRVHRWRRPLLGFGLLEWGVGAGALVALGVSALGETFDPTRLAFVAASPVLATLARVAVAVLAMGLPAFCMGGTLPALAEQASEAGPRVGGLYAANLSGAVLGTLAVPFVLLPRFGADGSYALAVSASFGVGLVACALGWRRPPTPRAPVEQRPASPGASLALLAALSGAATLGLQVLATRALALVHESSVYAFATVLAVFLLGLAGGAELARRARASGRAWRRVVGASWLVAGVLVTALPRLLFRLTDGLAYLPAGDDAFGLLRLLALGGATLLPATLALGVALPSLLDAAGGAAAGSGTGRLLAANTLGALAGPLLATFVLTPWLGLWPACVAWGLALILAGAVLTWRPRGALAVVAAALLACVAFGPAGVPPVRVDVARGERLVAVREGLFGTTAVLADAHDRWLTVNNSYILGGAAAAAEERFQAHLPLLLHPAARRVAFVGLGTGITAGAALAHPVERVVGLEIVAEVVEAARHDFAAENRGLLGDARVRVLIDDGRRYFAAPGESFDVVVGDLLVPWRAGEASLYSREHFAAVRRALAPGGLFCQWLPVYQLSAAQLAIVARTFADVFPQASLWRGNFVAEAPTLALIGQSDEVPLDVAAIDARLRDLAARRDADEALLAHPAGLWLHALGPLQARSAWLLGAPLHRDARPWLELLSPVVASAEVAAATRAASLVRLADELGARPVAGTPLSGLDATHRAWRDAGRALAQASAAGTPEGEARVLALLQKLPAELRQALHVPQP